jgi:hypothetical protein
MKKNEIDQTSDNMLNAVADMRRRGIISERDKTVLNRKIKAWWYDEKRKEAPND